MPGSVMVVERLEARNGLLARYSRLPFSVRIVAGAALGTLVGLRLHGAAEPLGDIGMLVIRLLKALATPLILFAILDAFMRTRIPARKGATLVAISLLNATVAIVIGLTVANVLRGGERWQGRTDVFTHQAPAGSTGHPAAAGAKGKAADEMQLTLDPVKNISSYIPESLLDPFEKNRVIGVVLVALLVGASLRKLKERDTPELATGIEVIESLIRTVFQLFVQMLEWILWLIPFAVFAVVAGVVGRSGTELFRILGMFLATVLFGLFLHAFVYYSLLLWVVGRASPRRFYAGALDAIVTALSCGSSLATLPVTLRCLQDKLKVSTSSARLAACVGTNLNHDGIILYEAVAALFMAQAFGYHLGFSQQITVALASVMAGIGIARVPEAGLITLPLVLTAVGLPTAVTAAVLPIMLPVDWIIGRGRAMTNVISDMTVATLLDRLGPQPQGEAAPVAREAEA